MFSLIITLISIALVAALALATLYYGGPIFNLGADRANAAKVAAQGQQIMGALELYRAEKGVYPNTLADLVSEEYLKSIPVAQAEEARALSTALAAPGVWSLSSPGQPVIVLKPVSLATCMAYNKVNLGTSGVLQQARSTHLKQCIGTDVNNLMVVQPKASADLVFVASNPAAVVQIGPVIATPLPPLSDTTLNGWLPVVTAPPPPPPPAGLGALSYSIGQGPTTSLSFPDTEVDQEASPLVLTVTNTGTAAMTLTATPATTVEPFSVNPQTCASAVLSVGASCQMSVGFAPTEQQSYSGGEYQLTMHAVSGTTPVVNLSGTGAGVQGTVIYHSRGATLQMNEYADGYALVDTVSGRAGAAGFLAFGAMPWGTTAPTSSYSGAYVTGSSYGSRVALFDETAGSPHVEVCPDNGNPLWLGNGRCVSSAYALNADFTWEYRVWVPSSGQVDLGFEDMFSFEEFDAMVAAHPTSYFNGMGAGPSVEAAYVRNAWNHYALTRQGTTYRVFVNGNLVGAYAPPTARLLPGPIYYGYGNSTYDEIRLTKGQARYVTSFNPALAP